VKLVTWNINSVKAREERLLDWLDAHDPDVLCLQELKVVDEAFPREACEERGYHCTVFGQKTYNGVAILSKAEPSDVHRGLEDDVEDDQSRLVSAEVEGVHVLSAYFPNGGRLGSDKYAYKLAWMERLREYLARRFDPAKDRVVLAGDYNVAYPKDVAEPEEYEGTVLCNDEVRAAIAAFREWGMSDLFEPFHPKGGVYSWWDYRARGFERNAGLRIDHVYGTTPLAGRVIGAAVDRAERVPNGMGTAEEKKKQGKKVGPSDHAPVLVELDL